MYDLRCRALHPVNQYYFPLRVQHDLDFYTVFWASLHLSAFKVYLSTASSLQRFQGFISERDFMSMLQKLQIHYFSAEVLTNNPHLLK